MVPAEFHDFFVGAAGVSGALIGLLFVAISVVPETVGEASHAVARLRPAAALSAFLNALVVSLLALVPELDFASAAATMAVIGLLSMVTLLVLTVRDHAATTTSTLVVSLVSVVGQGVVYGFQLATSRELATSATPGKVLAGYAVLVVILFVLGINRAWQFVGADTPSLLGLLLGSGRRARTSKGHGTRPGAT